MEVHQACQSASTAKTAADKASVPGWHEFQSSIHGLADEARQAAPAGLFPSEPTLTSQQPSSAVQQKQLLCITQVSCSLHRNGALVLATMCQWSCEMIMYEPDAAFIQQIHLFCHSCWACCLTLQPCSGTAPQRVFFSRNVF